mgnify:CR=1 FL=1
MYDTTEHLRRAKRTAWQLIQKQEQNAPAADQ